MHPETICGALLRGELGIRCRVKVACELHHQRFRFGTVAIMPTSAIVVEMRRAQLKFLAFAVLLAACSPEVTQEAVLRDPHAVTVYDPDGSVLLAPGLHAAQVSVDGHGVLGWTHLSVRREEEGAIWIGQKPLVSASGRTSVSSVSNSPELATPIFRNRALYLTYPYWEGRSETARLVFSTPQPNVVSLHEAREPKFNGGGLILGAILAAVGTAVVVDGVARSGRSSGVRGTEIGFGAFFLGAGIPAIAVDVYGLIMPRTERIIYQAPQQ